MSNLTVVSEDFNLKRYIRNEQLNDKTLLTRLAKVAGYANTTAITKWLDNPERELETIDAFLGIIRELFPENEEEIIEKHVIKLDPKKKAARQMLEYLSNNRLLEAMKLLLDKMASCSNKESIEWAKVYEMKYQWQTEYFQMDKNEFLNNLSNLRVNDPILVTHIKLMKCYIYYHLDDHKMAYELSKEIAKELPDIKNCYISNAFNVKLNEVQSYINLYVRNDLEESRRNAEAVLKGNIGKTFNAYAYYTIGFSYFFTDYYKAVKNLQKSMALYCTIGRYDVVADVQESYEKLSVYWGKKDLSEPFVKAENEIYLRIKNDLDVTEMLEDVKFKNQIGDCEYNFLKAVAQDDETMLQLSMIEYVKQGNTFFATFPMRELKSRNFNEDVLSAIINMHS